MAEETIFQKSKVQSDSIRAKAKGWLGYIDSKIETLGEPGYNLFEYMTTWYLVFTYINWLACFYFLNGDNLERSDVDKLFTDKLGWEKGVGKVFWASARNPISHVAQANPFHSYAKLNGKDAYLMLDFFLPWTTQQPPYHLIPDFAHANSMTISISYNGLRPELVKLADIVATKIENNSNEKAFR